MINVFVINIFSDHFYFQIEISYFNFFVFYNGLNQKNINLSTKKNFFYIKKVYKFCFNFKINYNIIKKIQLIL